MADTRLEPSDATVDDELRRQVAEIARGVAEDQTRGTNRWLSVIGTILAALTLGISFLAFTSFQTFLHTIKDIESQAGTRLKRTSEYEGQARQLAGEVTKNRDQSQELLVQLQSDGETAKKIIEKLQTSEERIAGMEKELLKFVSALQNVSRLEKVETWKKVAELVGKTDKLLAAKVWILAGSIHEKNGECRKAVNAYNEAIGLAPDYPEAYYERGHAWIKNGIKFNAVQDFTAAREYACKGQNQGLCDSAALTLKHLTSGDWRQIFSAGHCR